MSKLFGIHEIDVNPGINEASFQKFFVNELAPAYAETGWKISLLKGDRGQRAGKYAVLFEIKSVEDRNRYSPAHNTMSEEGKRWGEANKDLIEALAKKFAGFSSTDLGAHLEYTDYIVLE